MLKQALGLPRSSVDKESACNAGDLGSIPGSERSPGERNGNPLQYSCLQNPMNRGAWQATVHRVARVRHDLATKQQHTTESLCCTSEISIINQLYANQGVPGGSDGKEPPAMQETWVRSLGWEDPLEKGEVTHSSILAWRIPWTVQSKGSQKVRHD